MYKEKGVDIIITRGDKTYSYTKKKEFSKRRLVASLSCLPIAAAAFLTYEYSTKNPAKDTSVSKKGITSVLSLPSSTEEEKSIQPSAVKTGVVLDYSSGKNGKVSNMARFEGVYRANQGTDYSFNKEVFGVLASFSGEISDVKEDNISGKNATVTDKDLSIIYQSLSDITVKEGDKVNQRNPIIKAGSNIHDKELGNHLHIVVEKNGKIIDPELIYGKTNTEIEQYSCGTIFIRESPSIHTTEF